MIYKVATALALVAAASATLYTEDHASQKSLWENFKKEHGRSYETMEEENRRFSLFVENLKLVDRRNELEIRAGGSAIHGITKFSDWSQAEFESTMLASFGDVDLLKGAKEHVSTEEFKMGVGKEWSTNPVRDQGRCGSCWAFSATEQIESDYIRVKGSSPVLSVEQVTQCSSTFRYGNYGCNGGWNYNAMQWVQDGNKLATDAQYPYTTQTYSGTTGTCNAPAGSYGISAHYKVTGESAMTSWVQNSGPLSVCVDASTWSSYTGGVMSVCGTSINHCVQAVGVDTGAGTWKIRNSWNTNWGENGYIRLKWNANTCGVTSNSYYANP